MPRIRFTIRRMMIVVAIVGSVIWAYLVLREWTLFYGFYTNKLASGKVVATRRAVHCEPTIVEGKSTTCAHDSPISDGTSCLVLRDYARDEDDCSPWREIRVRVLSGPHKDELIIIKRFDLRRR